MMSPLFRLRAAKGVASSSDIRRWRKGLQACRDEILAALKADTGKTESEGYLFEWVPVESALNFLEENVDSFFTPQMVASAMPKILGRRLLIQRRLPLGHILVVGTWNFPLSLHLVQILFAAAAGNKVTFKASPFAAELGKAFGRLLPKILGADRFEHWIPESDPQCLERIRSRAFDGVIFTGGTGGAKIFAEACATAMIPLIAEASGSESAVVLDSALSSAGRLKATVDHLLWATFHHTGQTCVTPRFWFVPRSRLEVVWDSAQSLLDATPETIETRSKLQHSRIEAEHSSWEQWAKKLPGAQHVASKLRPQFCLVKLPDMKSLPFETPGTFGPAAMIVGYDDLSAVVEWVRKSPWSLLTTVLGCPNTRDMDTLSAIDTTVISLNEAVTAAGDAAVPFGGRGASGYGVCHGLDGLRGVSRVQTWQEVRPWPGASLLKAVPSWTAFPRLRTIGGRLKALEDTPFRFILDLF